MFRLSITLALLFAGSFSFASTISCRGSYYMYSIQATTRSTGALISAPIVITVSSPFGSNHQTTFAAVTSDVRLGQYIHVQAQGSEGAGNLNVTYAGGSTYRGTLDAQTSVGAANVNVTCKVGNPFFRNWRRGFTNVPDYLIN